MKASIPFLYANSHELYNIRLFNAFAAGSIHLKKPSGGPKALIGSPRRGEGNGAPRLKPAAPLHPLSIFLIP